MPSPNFTALLLAAGEGTRHGGDVPKQFVLLHTRMLFLHGLAALDASEPIHAIVLVVPEGWEAHARDAVASVHLGSKLHAVVPGGSTRTQSVSRGLAACPPETTHVLVHDAARPCVTPALVRAVAAAAVLHGAATAAVPLTDTLLRAAAPDEPAAIVARDRMWAVQTPQAFAIDLLRAAHQRAAAAGRDATDDAGLVLDLGRPVELVAGSPWNLKLTLPEDFDRARGVLALRAAPRRRDMFRVGHGFDVHAFAPGRRLVLGGVEIACEQGGLAGHSDADVLSHAMASALLGSLALGDLGTHFPDTDPRWKDAASLDLLRRVAAMVRERGWEIANCDATVVAESPRLASHVAAMRANLARALDVDVDRVSVKATTAEKLGALGRREGIAAHAVALVERRAPTTRS